MDTPRALVLEQDQIAAYQRDGAVHLASVFDASWLDFLSKAADVALACPGPYAQDHSIASEPGGYYSDLQMSKRIPDFLTFAQHSAVGEIAATLMGSRRINLLHDAMWLKESGTSRRTPWHHDQPFYCMEGTQMCVMWIPLDDHPKEISLSCLKGSHCWAKRFRPERINGGWYDGYGSNDGFAPPPAVAENPDRFEVMCWDMRAGDCIVFQGLTVHGSAGNLTGHRRLAVSLVLVGDDAVYVERQGEMQPNYVGNGLHPGEAIDNDYFPRLFYDNKIGST